MRPRCKKSGLREVASYAAPVQWFAVIVASVLLSSPFGEATATAIEETDAGLAVAMTIEMGEDFETILVRPFSSFDELEPTAMVARGDGEWGAVVTVPTAENWSIVFDAVRADGTWERSEATDLIELGVDPIVLGTGEPAPIPSSDPIPSSTWWLIGAAVLGIAAIGALAWWAFMPSKGDDEEESEPSDEELPAT